MSDNYTVRKEVIVAASREHAFRVFTEGFDRWWPRTYHIGKADMESAILEPRTGGRWYEKGVDGTECEWGTVLAWEPPSRLVLAWKLTADYQYDPEFETEVEVTFEQLESNRTRVVLLHKNLDRYGEKFEQFRRSVGSEEAGWGGLLKDFGDEMKKVTSPYSSKALDKVPS